jgi:integral membrane sensor domain MASE1
MCNGQLAQVRQLSGQVVREMSGQVKPDEASTALAEIARRQEQVINAILMPAWYWWTVAACVAIGAAVDSNDNVVRAVVFPVAIGVIAGLTVIMILGRYRRARVRSNELLRGAGALSIVGTVWLVVGVTIGTGFGLRAAGAPIPATLATLVGGAVLLIVGPVLRRVLRSVMLRNLASARR